MQILATILLLYLSYNINTANFDYYNIIAYYFKCHIFAYICILFQMSYI